MEQNLLVAIISHMRYRIGESQHKLTKDKLSLTNLLTLCDKVSCLVGVGWVDIASWISPRLSEWFPTASLWRNRWALVWMSAPCGDGNWLRGSTHRVLVNGSSSNGQCGTSGVLWDWCQAQLCLISSESDWEDGIKCTTMKFPSDTKLSGKVDALEERATLQEDLDRLESG